MYKKLSSFWKKMLWFAVAVFCSIGLFLGYMQVSHATLTPNFGATSDGGIYTTPSGTGTGGNTTPRPLTTPNTGTTNTTGGTSTFIPSFGATTDGMIYSTSTGIGGGTPPPAFNSNNG